MDLNEKHKEIFQDTTRELVVYGGAGAGKSFSVADKICLRVAVENIKYKLPLTGAVIRRSMQSSKKTCIPLIDKRMKLHGIPYELNKVDSIARAGRDAIIYYISIANPTEIEKIKSLTDLDWIWIEEATELCPEAYEEAKRRLRGGSGLYKQIITTFNPTAKSNWVYNRFFVNNVEKSKKIKYTVDDNPYLIANDPEYVEELDSLIDYNINQYRTYRLGEFSDLLETIYSNVEYISNYDSIVGDKKIYGLDFGYNNPTALVEIKVKDRDYYSKELLYERKLTNPMLIERLKQLDIDGVIYCDSAEPDRIEEIYKAGFNAVPSDKSVKDGILYCQGVKQYADDGSENLKKEFAGYCWQKDKAGNIIDIPTKAKDHIMDAVRYAEYTDYKRYGFSKGVVFTETREDKEVW